MHVRRLVVLGGIGLVGALAVGALGAFGGAGGSSSAPLFAVLSGGEEVGANGEANAGDPNGVGAATVVPVGANRICYSIIVDGIAKPAAAHIHKGAAGVAGPVSVTLAQPAQGTAGVSSGCVTAPRSVVSGLKSNPGNWYVNVHTPDFPGGAVRGQLF